MLTREQISAVIKDITYKPGWTLHLGGEDNLYLQVQFDAPDNSSGLIERQHCRKWQLSYHMTVTEIVETAWKAVKIAEEHEARELFKYKGFDIFNSHVNVEQLVLLHETTPKEKLFEFRKSKV
jgi:hypothetical protein